MRTTKQLFKLFIFSLIFVSCAEDELTQNEVLTLDINSKDLIISGEGSGASTGSVSYISSDFKRVENNVFQRINGAVQFGTFLQSIHFGVDNAYVIVDNASTITVVDNSTFIKVSTITEGLLTPRYMTTVNGKGYVTNWGSTASETDDFVAVINLEDNTLIKTIPVGNGPERIIRNGDKLFVSHKGAFTKNNIVSVIDITSDVVTEITVEEKPDELFFNDAGQLVVLSEGKITYNPWPTVESETKAAIQIIDVNTNTVSKSLVFDDGKHPSLMVQDDNKIYYYLSGKVFELTNEATELPTKEVLSVFLSAMLIDNGQLFGVNASYSSKSDFKAFDLATKAEVFSAEVALGASKIYFTK